MNKLVIHVDGASRGNPGPASVGVEIRDEKGKVVKTVSDYIGTTTNNVAEYFGLITALQEAAILRAGKVHIFTDSELLAKQFSGEYKTKEPFLRLLAHQAKRLSGFFDECRVTHVPREENKAADKLANEALDGRELF